MNDEVITAEDTKTVTLEAEPITPIVENKAPSRDELKEKGWSAKELDAAEKRGMIEKKEDPKVEVKKDIKPDIGVPVKKEEPKEEAKTETEKKKDENKPNGNLPDFTFKTPEQEKAFYDAFGPGTPQRAMYTGMKNERLARQKAVAEKQRIELEAQLLKDRLEKLEGKITQEVDENGNPIDPDDKPMTMKQLKEMMKANAEEATKKQEELNRRANSVQQALSNQEEYVRSIYPDYEKACNLAADLMKNLETYIPERWKQEKAIRLIKELKVTAENADNLGPDNYNAAIISYELGQMHPNYGKQNNGDNSDDTDGNIRPEQRNNGSLTPEQMKRIEANTQRRASSASIPGGGGKRVVSVEDITIKDVLKMSSVERDNFRRKHPEKMSQLLRG